MHIHLEVIMPPTDNVEATVAQILAPFDENPPKEDDEDYVDTSNSFWDYWLIGGRWSGKKIKAKLGQDRIEAFSNLLSEKKVTVSSLRAGKPTLQPASQIPAIDALWREHFPDSPVKECLLFDHYKGNTGDVMRLDELPAEFEAGHVIIAGPSYRDDGSLEATYMIQDEAWNGVTHVKADWDGKVSSAIEKHLKHIESYKPEYIAKQTPKPDWLVVTVDYHS